MKIDRKLLAASLLLIVSAVACAALSFADIVSRPNSYVSGTKIKSAEVNADFNTLYNDHNGNIANANVKAAAGIVDTKLGTIETTNKVAVTALQSGIPDSKLSTISTPGKVAEAALPHMTTPNLIEQVCIVGGVGGAATNAVLIDSTQVLLGNYTVMNAWRPSTDEVAYSVQIGVQGRNLVSRISGKGPALFLEGSGSTKADLTTPVVSLTANGTSQECAVYTSGTGIKIAAAGAATAASNSVQLQTASGASSNTPQTGFYLNERGNSTAGTSDLAGSGSRLLVDGVLRGNATVECNTKMLVGPNGQDPSDLVTASNPTGLTIISSGATPYMNLKPIGSGQIFGMNVSAAAARIYTVGNSAGANNDMYFMNTSSNNSYTLSSRMILNELGALSIAGASDAAGSTYKFAVTGNALFNGYTITTGPSVPGGLTYNNQSNSVTLLTASADVHDISYTGTISTLIINANAFANAGHMLTIKLTQSGGPWPISAWQASNPAGTVRFAGGAFSPTNTSGATDILRFIRSGTDWWEISRAMDVK